MDDEVPPGTTAERFRAELSARFEATCLELERRLAAEPDVAGVTFTSVLPRTLHPQRWVEVDGEAAPSESGLGHRTGSVSIAPDYFDVLGAGILTGRAFHAGDVASGRPVVVVNQSFVQRVFEGRNPVGRRVQVRGAAHRGTWPVVRNRGDRQGPWNDCGSQRAFRDLSPHGAGQGQAGPSGGTRQRRPGGVRRPIPCGGSGDRPGPSSSRSAADSTRLDRRCGWNSASCTGCSSW